MSGGTNRPAAPYMLNEPRNELRKPRRPPKDELAALAEELEELEEPYDRKNPRTSRDM